MEKKCQVDENVSFSDDLSHGLSSSTSDNKPSMLNRRESEISAMSSDRVQSARQTSVTSDRISEAGEPIHKDRTDSNIGGASQDEPTNQAPFPHNVLKTLSTSSKESGNLQLSSVDSVDLKPCQSSNENTTFSGCSNLSDGSFCVVREKYSSHMGRKADILADHGKGNNKGCNFDLNEGMEPIPVVAKVGVPVGQPEKPLHFGGELRWRSSVTTSAFRPTVSSKNSERENGASCGTSRQSLASQGIDLNITWGSESHEDHNSVNFNSKQTERFALDLNLRSENGEKNRRRQGALRFDLNDSPAIEDSCKNMFEIGKTREMSRNYIPDSRRPSYWVDPSSMQGFNHVQSWPFLVAAPTNSEQLQMLVPVQPEISFLPSTFCPPGMLPHLNNGQHPIAPVIPHLSGSVVGAYPGTIHVIIDSPPQVLYPTSYATPIRPSFGENGGIALMEDGSRGERNVEFFVPVRNALPPLSAKRREPEGGWDYSQVNYRPMASRK